MMRIKSKLFLWTSLFSDSSLDVHTLFSADVEPDGTQAVRISDK